MHEHIVYEGVLLSGVIVANLKIPTKTKFQKCKILYKQSGTVSRSKLLYKVYFGSSSN